MIWAVLPGNHEPLGTLGDLLLPRCRRGLFPGLRRFGGRLRPDVRGDPQRERRARAGTAPQPDRAAVVGRDVLTIARPRPVPPVARERALSAR